MRALRVTTALGQAAPERCELGSDLAAALRALKEAPGPTALVFSERDLGELDRCRGLLVDRGWKPASKPLAPLLLRQAKIPLIRGGHSTPGQLLRSVRALVTRAEAEGDHNAYLVGADPVTFDALWSRAGTSSAAAAPLPADAPNPLTPPRSDGRAPPAGAGHGLSGLLEELSVPEQVEQKFVGQSDAAWLVHQLIIRAARMDQPVLILGDTGSGKEVVAKLIHDQSARRRQSFTAVNCGAIPRELLESELFGYEKGAHSTATARKYGLWQRADGGTLFLDEIADLSLDHQVKIFRALESGEIRPVGAEQDLKVDARVIAATNRDLYAMMQAGEFREDLYYRLRAFLIRTPPLREHPGDIPDLARHFWKSLTHNPAAELPSEVLEELARYRWPGNARELKMVLAGLLGLFGTEGVGVRQLQAVFEFEGQAGAIVERPLQRDELELHPVECLRQLKRADEVLHATEVALRPLSGEAPASGEARAAALAALEQPARELELLCMHRLLFHSELTFAAVRRVQDRLAALMVSLHQDAMSVPARRQLQEDLALALSSIFSEVQRLQEQARRGH